MVIDGQGSGGLNWFKHLPTRFQTISVGLFAFRYYIMFSALTVLMQGAHLGYHPSIVTQHQGAEAEKCSLGWQQDVCLSGFGRNTAFSETKFD